MKYKTILLSIIPVLFTISCNQVTSITDAWTERKDVLPVIENPKELTEEEILANEKEMGIERFEGLKYYPQGNEYYIWGCYQKFESLTIPDTYKNKPVSGIFWQEGLSFIGDTLKELRLGKNIKGLSSAAFFQNRLLTKIIIDESNEYFRVIDDVLYLIKTGNGVYDCSLIWVLPSKTGELVIKERVGPFDESSLKYADSITSIVIPDSMPCSNDELDYSFPNCAFCSSLLDFKVSEQSENYAVENGVLYSKDLKSLVKYPTGRKGNFIIPDSVENIFTSSFDGANIDELTIGKNVSNIADYHFNKCDVESINCNEENIKYSSFDGSLYTKNYLDLLFVPKGKGDVLISDKTKIIKNINNDKIEILTIPDSVTTIEHLYLPKLTEMVLGKGIINIKTKCFYWERAIDRVYYKGSIEDLNKIELEINNPSLVLSTRYFYSETKPNIKGNFWHYLNNQPTFW